jgi:peptidoglycan biosynthesis protein MviN/MurJ (putative lipid II flippase)
VLRGSGMLPLFASLLLTYLFSQFYVLAERAAMMRLGAGITSSFQYSTALVNVLISLLAYPLASLLWSQFLARAAKGDDKSAQALALRACGLLYYVLMVACVFIFTHAREIVSVLYGRGEFDELSVRMTTSALKATIFAAIPIGIGAVLGRWLLSQPMAHRQVWIGFTTTGVGLSVIGVAVVAEESYWVMLHWLLANLAGMVVSVFIFIRASRFDWPQRLAAARWLVLVGLVSVLALWLTPEVFLGTSVIQVTIALFLQGATYLLITLVLSWLFRVTATLRYLFRGSS